MFVCFFFLIAVRVQMYISMLLGRPLVLLAVRKTPSMDLTPNELPTPSMHLYSFTTSRDHRHAPHNPNQATRDKPAIGKCKAGTGHTEFVSIHLRW